MAKPFQDLIVQVLEQLRPQRVWPKIITAYLTLLVSFSAIIFFVAIVYGAMYEGRVYPGVYLGDYSVGGLKPKEVKILVENVNNRLTKEGISILAEDTLGVEHKVLLPALVANDSNGEFIKFDSEAAVAKTYAVGRDGGAVARLLTPLYLRTFAVSHVPVPVVVNDQLVRTFLQSSLAAYEDAPHNASFDFSPNSITQYRIVKEASGKMFNYDDVIFAIKNQLASLSFDPIKIKPELFSPTITESDIEKIAPKLGDVFSYGSLSLNYIDPQTKYRRDWEVNTEQLANWLVVSRDKDGLLIFSLSKDAVQTYFSEKIKPLVDTTAQDAKFVVENNKVKEFQASRTGLQMDMDKTVSDFIAAFENRNYRPEALAKTVSVTATSVEPKIKTADVNDLGIVDVVGVGVSTFKDSHTNRIKNIANAVKRLNGTLIKPGEEFSANKYAGPYTLENGFLPEQVIKGNEIKPEVGGGMCQIGTTLFRMAMNSGFDITQRRNHSLVVSYYADPVNGNPGTDATLYEPALDLKFVNDSGHYLLLQTDVDYVKQQLTFTLWGTPDGRSGSYTHPIVSKWIPAGESPADIVVTDGSLKPGQRKCQNAFRGAVASFVYTRYTPTGEKIERVFDSYYRPLPKICTVGAATSSPAAAVSSTGTGIIDAAE